MVLSKEQKAVLDQHYAHYMSTTGDRPPKEMCTALGKTCKPPVLPATVGRHFANKKKNADGERVAIPLKPAQLELLEKVYRETRYPYTGTRFIIMAQTGLQLKKVKEWFENRNSSLTKKAGGKVVPGYGKNTKYAKAMTKAYEEDPQGYVQKLLTGTINLQTGEEQIPSPGPYGTQPKGHPHPVLVKNDATSDGGTQIDSGSASKMRRDLEKIESGAHALARNGLLTNESLEEETEIDRVHEHHRFHSHKRQSLPQNRGMAGIMPVGDSFAQQKFRKYLKPAHHMDGRHSMQRNEPIEFVKGSLTFPASYDSTSQNLHMAPKFRWSKSRNVCPDFQKIKKEDSLNGRSNGHYLKQIEGPPKHSISSQEKSFGTHMPGDYKVNPQHYTQLFSKISDDISARSKNFQLENDSVSRSSGAEYEDVSPKYQGTSHHPNFTPVDGAATSKGMYGHFPRRNLFGHAATRSFWQEKFQAPQNTDDSDESFAASAGPSTIDNGVDTGAHISGSVLPEHHEQARLANNFSNKRSVQQTGTAKSDNGIGLSNVSVLKLANAAPNGAKLQGYIDYDNLTFRDFIHAEDYGEIMDLIGTDSDSDENTTAYRKESAENIAIKHIDADESSWKQDHSSFLTQKRRSPSYACRLAFPSVGTPIEGSLEPSGHEDSSILRNHPEIQRPLEDVTEKFNGNTQAAQGSDNNQEHLSAVAAEIKSLKRGRRAENSPSPATSGGENQTKRLRVRHETSQW
ncbi:hypothetical protein ACMFMG_009454 [Clarireedia jacksonii]